MSEDDGPNVSQDGPGQRAGSCERARSRSWPKFRVDLLLSPAYTAPVSQSGQSRRWNSSPPLA